MSADNGYIIRKNKDDKFVLQMYFASDEELPSIGDPQAEKFDTLEAAVLAYNELAKTMIVEYNLMVHIDEVTE